MSWSDLKWWIPTHTDENWLFQIWTPWNTFNSMEAYQEHMWWKFKKDSEKIVEETISIDTENKEIIIWKTRIKYDDLSKNKKTIFIWMNNKKPYEVKNYISEFDQDFMINSIQNIKKTQKLNRVEIKCDSCNRNYSITIPDGIKLCRCPFCK